MGEPYMDVIVDNERNFRFEGTPEDVLSAVVAVEAWLHERERAMVSVVVDGVSLTPDNIVEHLQGRALESVGSLEIDSAPVAEMVRTCLDEMRAALPDLAAACHGLAEVFHGEAPEEGFEPFQELARIWEHIKTRQLLIASALKLDLASLQIGGMPLQTIHQELNEHLAEAEEALREGDCILLGDLLEYELAPRAEREAEIAALLGQYAGTGA